MKPMCPPGQGEPPSSRGHPGALSPRALRGWRFVRDRGASSRWVALVIQQQGRTDGLWEAIHLTDEEIEGRLGHGVGRPLARDGTGLSGDEPVNAPSPADPASTSAGGRPRAGGRQEASRDPHTQRTQIPTLPRGPELWPGCCTNVTGTPRLSGSVAPQVGCFAWDSPGTVGSQDLGDPSVVAVPLTLWKPSASPSRVLPPLGGVGPTPGVAARGVLWPGGQVPALHDSPQARPPSGLTLPTTASLSHSPWRGGGSRSRLGRSPGGGEPCPKPILRPRQWAGLSADPEPRRTLGNCAPPCQGSRGGRAWADSAPRPTPLACKTGCPGDRRLAEGTQCTYSSRLLRAARRPRPPPGSQCGPHAPATPRSRLPSLQGASCPLDSLRHFRTVFPLGLSVERLSRPWLHLHPDAPFAGKAEGISSPATCRPHPGLRLPRPCPPSRAPGLSGPASPPGA